MDIERIEVVLKALELGSFSKAADKYNYTPSALTHIADALEGEIGTKFIKRTNKGISVENKYIVGELEKICEIKNRICTLNREVITLTIGTYSSIAKHILPSIIKLFNRIYPKVKLEIYIEDKRSILIDKGIDIIFTEFSSLSNYTWKEITVDPYVAVCPLDFDLGEVFSFDRKYFKTFLLSNETVIMEKINAENFSSVIKVDAQDDSSIIQMIEEDMGMSILPYLCVKDNKNVKTLPISPNISRTLGLLYKKNNTKKEYISEFEKCLKGNV